MEKSSFSHGELNVVLPIQFSCRRIVLSNQFRPVDMFGVFALKFLCYMDQATFVSAP